MVFTYDTTTDRGKVRLLLGDTDSTNAIFDDAETDAFLAMGDDEPFLAAAVGAESIASSEMYIQKVIEIMDLKTDGAKVAAEWRQKAKQWRQAYADSIGETGDDFDWAEFAGDPFSRRERVANEALRA